MAVVDIKKSQKEFYTAGWQPNIIHVPSMNFLTIEGKGDPNDKNGDYPNAIAALFGVAYHIKMNNKHICEYVVPPLEGLWHVDDDLFRGGGASITDKSKFTWVMMIRQPDFVTTELFEQSKSLVQQKRPDIKLDMLNFAYWYEGLCVQSMHVGAYDNEADTITRMNDFLAESPYDLDFNNGRKHHEIYLSDPRKTDSSKLKTIIRHPVVGKNAGEIV